MKPDGSAIPATAYRAVGSPAVAEAQTGTIAPRSGGTYVTFDNLSDKTASEAKSMLQLPSTPEGYVTFDTLPHVDSLSIPKGNYGLSPNPEPITSTFPQYGEGGSTQAITKLPISVDEFSWFAE